MKPRKIKTSITIDVNIHEMVVKLAKENNMSIEAMYNKIMLLGYLRTRDPQNY